MISGVRYDRIFPKTITKEEDLLLKKGGVGVGCYVFDGKLKPAYTNANQVGTVMKDIKCAGYFNVIKKHILNCGNYILASDGEMVKPAMRALKADEISFLELNTSSERALEVVGDTIVAKFLSGDGASSSKPYNGGACGCVRKNGRVFGIDGTNRYKIKWSGEGGVEDWTEGISGAGWMVVQWGLGEILNLVVFADTLIAVREFGLTFVSAYGNPENFKQKNYDGTLPKIFKNTACIVGGNLAFYTEDGLYFFDGNKVKKSELELADEIASPRRATVREGKYYLCGESKTLARPAVLVADEGREFAYIIDFPAEALSVGDRIFAYKEKYQYELLKGGEYGYITDWSDFEVKGKKVLKEIIIECDGEVQIEATNGVISRIVRGVRGKFRPNMRGERFKIAVTGTGEIKKLTAVAEV